MYARAPPLLLRQYCRTLLRIIFLFETRKHRKHRSSITTVLINSKFFRLKGFIMLLELSGTSNEIFINSSLKVLCNVNVTYLHGLKEKKKEKKDSRIWYPCLFRKIDEWLFEHSLHYVSEATLWQRCRWNFISSNAMSIQSVSFGAKISGIFRSERQMR